MQITQQAPPAARTAEEDMVLGQLLRVIIDDIGWLLGIAAVVVAIAVLYCFVAKPLYQADTAVRVEPADYTTQALTQTQSGAAINAGASSQEALPTDAEIAMIQSRSVLEPVVKEFKLNFSVSPKTVPFLGSLANRLATPGAPSRPWFGLSSFAWGGEIADVDSITVSPGLEGEKLTMTALSNGRYALAGPDGQPLLQGVVGQTAEGGGVTMLVGKLVARPGTRFTVVRMNDFDAVTAFQKSLSVQEEGKQTGVIDISLYARNAARAAAISNAVAQSYLANHIDTKQEDANKMLAFLRSEQPRLKSDLEKAEAALSAYQKQSGSIDADGESKVFLEGSVQYEQQISALKLQIASLQQRFGDAHPLLIAARQQLAQLEGERNKYETRFRDLPATEVKAVQLQRDAKVAQDIYVLLLNRIQELSVQRVGTGGNVHIVDTAMRPGTPAKPKKTLIVSAAALLGLILGTGFVLLRRNMFKGIVDAEQIERTFQLPVYGLVPLSHEQGLLEKRAPVRGGNRMGELLANACPRDLTVESPRSLRTSLQFGVLDAKNRVVMLTGSVPGVGKSFLTANLAVLLAHSGKRVLMIDGDMRRGSLERHLGGAQENGFSELLSGQIALDEAVRATNVDNLHFISCGRRPPNPSELLMSPRLGQYLETLSQRYDVLLIDTPPVLAVTDAAIIGAHAGTTFLVVRSGMHSEGELADTLKRLRTAGVRVEGGIFNAVPPHARGSYGYGYAAVQEYLSA